MNDITELAQRLKAAAEKATPGRWEYYPGNTSIEYNVDSMDEDQGSIVYVDSGDFTQAQTDRNGEFIAMANPANVMALVEALEKAQQGEKQWREVVDAFCADDAEWHNLTNSTNELISLLSQSLCKQADRIAELESRLNSADKLQDSAFRSGLQHGFSLGQTDDQKGYEQSMAAYSPDAAIKWESA
ncbi:ead/Ea22-like family protein [Klebsiella oxytoca]